MMHRDKLKEFVKAAHGSQKRKYTDEPYFTHVERVAQMTDFYNLGSVSWEIALCHDLYEDTDVNFSQLNKELLRLGYNLADATMICFGVQRLTDVYTREKFPNDNREKRKTLEAMRLAVRVSVDIRNIKLCDMIDNTLDIVEHDKNFAKVYLKEKQQLLDMFEANEDPAKPLNKELMNLARGLTESSLTRLELC